jgi:hypothetical protein
MSATGMTALIAIVARGTEDSPERLRYLLREPSLVLDLQYKGRTPVQWAHHTGRREMELMLMHEAVRWGARLLVATPWVHRASVRARMRFTCVLCVPCVLCVLCALCVLCVCRHVGEACGGGGWQLWRVPRRRASKTTTRRWSDTPSSPAPRWLLLVHSRGLCAKNYIVST